MLRIAPVTKYGFPEKLADLNVGEYIALMVQDGKKPTELHKLMTEKDEDVRLKYAKSLNVNQRMKIAEHFISVIKLGTKVLDDETAKDSVDFEDLGYDAITDVYKLFMNPLESYVPRDNVVGAFWVDKQLYGCDTTVMNETKILNPSFGEYATIKEMGKAAKRVQEELGGGNWEYLLEAFALFCRPIEKHRIEGQRFFRKRKYENRITPFDKKTFKARAEKFKELPATFLLDFAFFLTQRMPSLQKNISELLPAVSPQNSKGKS